MWFFGPSRGANLLAKADVVRAATDGKERLDQLYGILTILDQKATGLLTVNAFLIAALAALLAIPEPAAKIGVPLPRSVLTVQMIALGISAFLCLPVIRITWRFLYYIPETTGGDLSRELRRLANVIDDRTHCYWFAWFAALAGFLLIPAWWSWCYAGIAFLVTAAWLLVQKVAS